MCPIAQNENDNKIRCVVAHDIAWLRQGVRRLLDDEPDIAVVAEAEDAAQTLREVFTHQPAIVVVDHHIFEGTAVQTERLIVRESPRSKVLFLTNHDEETRGQDLTDTAYAVRRTSAEELVNMVRKTAAVEAAAPQETPVADAAEWTSDPPPRRRELTAREREVLKLLAQGKTVRSAASMLGLSTKTVDAHKFNLMRKLGVHNKAELVMWAIQRKLVKVPANF
ncbi:MAG TPA: response regulator transcription factor [Terriglobia bacterium]|nr:response regulator transcription factor [Terriglobia bacterium]